MKTIIIIQARMGSTRLSGKVLMPLGNTVVLDYVVSRCKQIDDIEKIIVATSTLDQDDPIIQWCEKNQVSYYRGPEDDVLTRYVECASQYEPDYVIRVTADCPFVDFEMANQIVKAMLEKPSDIVLVDGKLPRGLVVEMIAYDALKYIHQYGQESRHREHVTYYAYEYPNQFQRTVFKIPLELNHPELRITLDTLEDYQLCQAIANHFNGDMMVPSQAVVNYLLTHPEVAKINAHIQQKPVI